jgi:SspJ family small acid-soluble spore protein
MADNNFYSNGNGGIWQADQRAWEINEGNFSEHDNFLFEKDRGNESENETDCSYDVDGFLRDAGQDDCW